jgi:phenylalanyl-tRNA synthetase beta chain
MADVFGLNDPIIEIAITPNRADCTGIYGIARDLAAAGLGTLKPIQAPALQAAGSAGRAVKLECDDKAACPHFIGRLIKNVKNGPSPKWMQDRLKAIGLRPISALVDVTNYMSMAYARPLHVFDADKLKGDIVVRLSQGGESFEGLDEKTYTLSEGMTVVCDDSGVLGLGGIMGGESTGCGDETVNVFLEGAYFDPMRTAKTGRALSINSDARYRFERGIDPAFTSMGVELATALILQLCGGEASEVYVAGAAPDTAREVAYAPSRAEELLGFAIPETDQEKILTDLGFTITENAGNWSITPPSWRGDIEGSADIVEEVGRITGFDRIKGTKLPEVTRHHSVSSDTQIFARGRVARAALASLGYQECVTWSFMKREIADLFGANQNQDAAKLALLNPISSELAQMRPSILPNLIDAAKRNLDRGLGHGSLFEVGPIFMSSKPDGYKMVAAGLLYGAKAERHWRTGANPSAVDFYDVKKDAYTALEALGAPVANLQATSDAPDYFHPGRSAALRLGPNVMAYVGDIHPGILAELDMEDVPLCAFEIILDTIPEPKKKGSTRPLLKASSLQPVKRDFAFLLKDDVEAEQIVRAARSAEKSLVTDVEIFDIYQGKGVEPGHKSVAFSVTLQPTERTLTDSEIDGVSKKIVEAVSAKTGGALRG